MILLRKKYRKTIRIKAIIRVKGKLVKLKILIDHFTFIQFILWVLTKYIASNKRPIIKGPMSF